MATGSYKSLTHLLSALGDVNTQAAVPGDTLVLDIDGNWKGGTGGTPTPVLDTELVGFSAVPGVIDSNDTILSAFGKAQGSITNLENVNVRATRFASIGAGTSGTVTVPANNTVILDTFGGTTDAVVSTISGGKPTFLPAVDASNNVIGTTFDTNGNYVLSGTPAAYPVALIYRTRCSFINFNEGSADIVGEHTVEQDHNSLVNVQGGTTSQYYHLTSAEYGQLHSLHFHGVTTIPSWTDNSNGTISLGSNGVGNFYQDALGTTIIKQLSIPAASNISLTDNAVNYIYAEYNNGSPTYLVTTSPASFISDFRQVAFLRVIRNSNTLHILDYDTYGTALPEKQFYKDIASNPFNRQTGLVLSTAATRIATVTAGTVWFGVKLFTLDENVSGTSGALFECYKVAGVWNYAAVSAYDSSYYCDGTNRQNLGSGKYVAKYFFRGVEVQNHVYYVHGNTYNHSSEALAESIPDLPAVITGHGIYIGKVVIVQGASNGTAYPVDWVTGASLTATSEHNNLAGLQGGTSSQFYHLTQAQHGKTIALNDQIRGPTGFLLQDSIDMAYDSNTLKLTINTAGGAVFKGETVSSLVNGWISSAHATNNGTYYKYFDGTNYTWSTNGFGSFDGVQIGVAYKDASVSFGMVEAHGAAMDPDDHRNQHFGLGTQKLSGGGTSQIVLNSYTAANRRPYIDQTIVLDEDKATTLPALATNSYTQVWLTGTIDAGTNEGTLTWATASADVVNLTTTRPNVNILTSGTGVLTPLSAANHMSVWLLAVPVTSDANSQKFRYIWVQGQTQTTTAAAQTSIDPRTLDTRKLARAIPEAVFIKQVVIEYVGGGTNDWRISAERTLTGSRVNQISVSGTSGLSSVNSDTNYFSGLGTPASPLTTTTLATITQAKAFALVLG